MARKKKQSENAPEEAGETFGRLCKEIDVHAELRKMQEMHRMVVAENQSLREKSAYVKGDVREDDHRDQLLAHLERRMTGLSAPREAKRPTSPEEALALARQGDLDLWQFPYTPGAETHALSEIVKVQRRLDKIDEALAYLIRRG